MTGLCVRAMTTIPILRGDDTDEDEVRGKDRTGSRGPSGGAQGTRVGRLAEGDPGRLCGGDADARRGRRGSVRGLGGCGRAGRVGIGDEADGGRAGARG